MPIPATLASVFSRLYGVYFSTLRIRMLLSDGAVVSLHQYPFGCEVFALCERDSVALAGVAVRARFTVLADYSRDGDLAAAVLQGIGARVVRGSSRRDGTRALLTLLRTLRTGDRSLGLVVDGPLGPSGTVKAGALLCALRSGRPLRAVAAAARHQIVLTQAWSAMYFPVPFSRVLIVVDAPLLTHAPAMSDNPQTWTQELTARLATCRQLAVDLVRAQPDLWRRRPVRRKPVSDRQRGLRSPRR